MRGSTPTALVKLNDGSLDPGNAQDHASRHLAYLPSRSAVALDGHSLRSCNTFNIFGHTIPIQSLYTVTLCDHPIWSRHAYTVTLHGHSILSFFLVIIFGHVITLQSIYMFPRALSTGTLYGHCFLSHHGRVKKGLRLGGGGVVRAAWKGAQVTGLLLCQRRMGKIFLTSAP